MIGGLTGWPVANATGPGHADADAAHVLGGAVGLASSVGEALVRPCSSTGSGPVGDVQVERHLGERRAGEVADGEPRVGGAEVGGEHDAGELVEGEDRRRPAAGRGAAAGLVDELVREQGVDALGDGGAGEAGPAREVRAGDRLAVADQPQHRAGAEQRRGGDRRLAGARMNGL